MRDHDLLILTQRDVHRILEGREGRIIELAREAYEYHRDGRTIVPPSAFLRLSDSSRAIALPAFVGGGTEAVGMKWVSSFPTNPGEGLPRAIGTIILNSARNGLPFAFMDGTLVSAKRTAAGAALAATFLAPPATESVGLVGTGPINEEIARFLRACFPGLRQFFLHDVLADRAEALGARLRAAGHRAEVVPSIDDVFRRSRLVSFATSAVRPHVDAIPDEFRGGTILHISLRDLSPEVILSAYNVVDDIDHICQHETSVHLAETRAGHRDFIHATLGELLAGATPPASGRPPISVYSPFGLGALDVVLANDVYRCAVKDGAGTVIRGMFGLDAADR